MRNDWQPQLNAHGNSVVFPLDDTRAHDLDNPCWCDPFMDENIEVHNSHDGRERLERGWNKPS